MLGTEAVAQTCGPSAGGRPVAPGGVWDLVVGSVGGGVLVVWDGVTTAGAFQALSVAI